MLQGEADQSPGQEPGDIVFILDEREHKTFKRMGADLHATLKATLAEALCGFSRVVIKTLDGRGLHMDHQKPIGGVLKPEQIIKIANEGMPIKRTDSKGDLYLTVEVLFPEDDWLQDETITSKLQEILPKPEPPIQAETVDEVTYDADADIEHFGGDQKSGAWEDDDEDGHVHGHQCPQQ